MRAFDWITLRNVCAIDLGLTLAAAVVMSLPIIWLKGAKRQHYANVWKWALLFFLVLVTAPIAVGVILHSFNDEWVVRRLAPFLLGLPVAILFSLTFGVLMRIREPRRSLGPPSRSGAALILTVALIFWVVVWRIDYAVHEEEFRSPGYYEPID